MISITFKLTNCVVESKHVFKASERYKTFWIQFNYNGEFFTGISEERKHSGMSYSHPKQCQEVSRIVQLWLAEYMLTEGKSVHWGKLLSEHNTLLITTGLYVDVPILIFEPCEDHRPAQSQTENVCVHRATLSAPWFFPRKSLPAWEKARLLGKFIVCFGQQPNAGLWPPSEHLLKSAYNHQSLPCPFEIVCASPITLKCLI